MFMRDLDISGSQVTNGNILRKLHFWKTILLRIGEKCEDNVKATTFTYLLTWDSCGKASSCRRSFSRWRSRFVSCWLRSRLAPVNSDDLLKPVKFLFPLLQEKSYSLKVKLYIVSSCQFFFVVNSILHSFRTEAACWPSSRRRARGWRDCLFTPTGPGSSPPSTTELFRCYIYP